MSGFGYNAEYYDVATGMQYLRARYYEPEMMRFSQTDIVRGSVVVPISLNRYLYVQNNPVLYSDPSGMVVKAAIRSTAVSAAGSVKKTVAKKAANVTTSAAKVTSNVAKAVRNVTTKTAKVSNKVTKTSSVVSNNKKQSTISTAVSTVNSSMQSTRSATLEFADKKWTYTVPKTDNGQVFGISSASCLDSTKETIKDVINNVLFRLIKKNEEFTWNTLNSISFDNLFKNSLFDYFATIFDRYLSAKNYKNNVEVLSNSSENIYTDGFIERQYDSIWNDVNIGLSTITNSGCGAIATYNVLVQLNDTTNIEDIILWYDINSGTNIEGFVGINPFIVDDYFTEHGYSTTVYTDESQLPTTIQTSTVIVAHWNQEDNIFGNAHFVALTEYIKDNGDNYYKQHNNGNSGIHYESIAEYYQKNSDYQLIYVIEIYSNDTENQVGLSSGSYKEAIAYIN